MLFLDFFEAAFSSVKDYFEWVLANFASFGRGLLDIHYEFVDFIGNNLEWLFGLWVFCGICCLLGKVAGASPSPTPQNTQHSESDTGFIETMKQEIARETRNIKKDNEYHADLRGWEGRKRQHENDPSQIFSFTERKPQPDDPRYR